MALYSPTGIPANKAQLLSQPVRAEFLAVAAAFALFPDVSAGNALKVWRVNAAGTAVEAIDGSTVFVPIAGGTMTGPLTINHKLTIASAGNPWFAMGASGGASSFGVFYRAGGTVAAGYLGTDNGGILGGGTGIRFGIRSDDVLLLLAGAGSATATLNGAGQFASTSFSGDGSALTNLSATNIAAGTLGAARGGTGLSSYTAGNYINALNSSTLQQRTPAQVLSDIGALASSSYTAADVLSKLLGVDGASSGLDADLLDGSNRDSAYNGFVGNSIPVRHSSGYLFSNYFNMTADIQTGAASHIAMQTSGDGYLRWQTPAQFIANHSIAVTSGAVTFAGLVKGNGGGAGLGAITISSSAPSGGADGDLWLQF